MDLIAVTRDEQPDWELAVIAGEEGPLLFEIETLGATVEVIPFPPRLALVGDSQARSARSGHRLRNLGRVLRPAVQAYRYAGRLSRAIRRFKPDIVHTNGAKMHLLGAWATPHATPVLWHVHDYISPRPIISRLMRLSIGRCAAIITNSESVGADFRKTCGTRRPVVPLHPGIDLTAFSPNGPKADLDGLAGLPESSAGTVKIGLIGTMARWKGHEIFLNALAKLPYDCGWRGYVIGGPIYRANESQYSPEELKALADRLGLYDRVGFTGFINDPGSAIRALDIVVHASTLPEPFGRVIAEAMACAKPVIISLAGGAKEIILDGEDALSHPPGNEMALAEQIHILMKAPKLRMQLGEKARAAMKNKFDRRISARATLSLYKTLREAVESCESYT